MTVDIRQESQKPETDNLIELFSLDLTKLGGDIYFFIASSYRLTEITGDPGEVIFQGNTYVPFDMIADGFELDGKGSSPTPKIKFSLTNPLLTGYINAFEDLIGATITRIKTYKKFLDTEPTANPSAHFPLEIYRVERKASENRIQVEFELSSVMDQRGAELPGRTITTFYCPWRYRFYKSGAFVYAVGDHACPYVGSSYFDTDNNVVADPALDRCNKAESGCRKRFGDNAVLPFGGFPGASRAVIS